MKTKTRKLITAIAITGVALSIAGPATTAMALGPLGPISPGISKAECLSEIAHSLSDLDAAAADLGGSDTVTDEHRATLEENIAFAEEGLSVAQTTVSATRLDRVITDVCTSIDSDYPVSGLIVPQVEITITADRIASDEAVVIDPDDTFLHAAEAAEIAGADMTKAVALYNRSMAEFSQAFEIIDGVADSALSVTPSYFEVGVGSVYISNAQADAYVSLSHYNAGWDLYKAANASYDEAIAAL